MSYDELGEIKKNRNINVYIRMRPLLKYEDEIFWKINEVKDTIYSNDYNSFSEDDNYEFSTKGKGKIFNLDYSPKIFYFDKIYTPKTESQIIYKEICQNIIKNFINGLNGSIFMYGQTTSGKTFTMLGTPNNPGILPCSLNDIFIMMNENSNIMENIKFNIYCCYIEIYNEKVNDLLNNTNSTNLKLIDDKKYGTIVAGAKRVKIKNFEEGIAIKDYGEENRKYRETLLNEYSSRSHCVFQIYLEQFHFDEEGNNIKNIYSILNLIDLAGSERINEKEKKLDNIEETGYINKSLFVLANIINKLVESSSSSFNKNIYIPYRDSKLTRLLSQSLGGNSLTTILCTISPAKINYNQTLSTLRFASRAKFVKLEPKKNEILNDKSDIFYYQKEIQKLKEQLRNRNEIIYNNINDEKIKNISQYEYNIMLNAYENLKYELQNYKNLYLKEKKKSEMYKAQINKEGNINSFEKFDNNDNDFITNSKINNKKTLMQKENDGYEQLKEYIKNKNKYNLIDLNYGISSNKKYEIENQKQNNNIETKNYKIKNKMNKEKINENNLLENSHDNINSILNGNVFEMIDLNYNELLLEGNDISKNKEILNKTYSFKLNAIEKTAEYYESFLKEYFTQKFNEINYIKDESEKDYMINLIKNQYENLSNKLIILYKDKKDNLEKKFSIFLNDLCNRKRI